MSAELLVLGGARASESFSLGERATIGSDPDCDVRLEGPDVRPRHAVLTHERAGGYRIQVLEGAPDVVVNGSFRRDARLYHGQKLVLGGVELQLLAAAERNPKDTSLDFISSHELLGDAPSPHVEVVWKSDRYKTEIGDRARQDALDARDRALRTFFFVAHAATSERSVGRILERATDAVQTLRPDRTCVVLYERDEDRLVPAVVRRGPGDRKGSRIPVSPQIVRKSAVEGISLLTQTRREGEEFDRPVLCVPLSSHAEALGAFYLERLPGGAPFTDEDLDLLAAVGRIVGLAVERARLEADSRSRAAERDRERSRWHAAVEGLSSGVLFVDAEGRVELANPAARRILAERLGVTEPGGLATLGGAPLRDLVTGEAAGPIEIVVPGEPEVVLEVRPSPLLDPDGVRSGAALVLDDVTEDRLRKAKLAQAEKLSMLGEMLAGVAHEINNPLATVLGFAEVLGRKASGETKAGLDAILEEAERCRRIVGSLLAFARPRKKERAPVDLGEVAGSVLDLLAHEIKAVPVEAIRELEPLPSVLGDRYELQQVFFNLVKNSIDALRAQARPGGKVVVSASVRSSPDGAARVRVEVRDSGPGLADHAQGELVPRPFFTTKGESGTGLGLSIAHGIVHEHGGSILAGTAPEGGAAFAVELPVATAEPARGDAEPQVRSQAGTLRILIVDDEENVRSLLARVCRELGYVPLTATDGREALTLLGEGNEVAAVLVDVRMPVMDGMAFYEALRARGHPLARRIVFLSGDLARAETAAFLKEAGLPVLAKPFRLAQVCRALEDVLATA